MAATSQAITTAFPSTSNRCDNPRTTPKSMRSIQDGTDPKIEPNRSGRRFIHFHWNDFEEFEEERRSYPYKRVERSPPEAIYSKIAFSGAFRFTLHTIRGRWNGSATIGPGGGWPASRFSASLSDVKNAGGGGHREISHDRQFPTARAVQIMHTHKNCSAANFSPKNDGRSSSVHGLACRQKAALINRVHPTESPCLVA
jgi:hypothetical protein